VDGEASSEAVRDAGEGAPSMDDVTPGGVGPRVARTKTRRARLAARPRVARNQEAWWTPDGAPD